MDDEDDVPYHDAQTLLCSASTLEGVHCDGRGFSFPNLHCEQEARKRQSACTFPEGLEPSLPGALADDGVAALLPKMKRMRLRPSLGQLRLQREVEDAGVLSSLEVRLCVEPEHLRAAITLRVPVLDGPCLALERAGGSGCGSVQLEATFPPQYPHRPPKIMQVSPEGLLPAWQYDGRRVVLARLTDGCWSPAMGVLDIVRDLLQPIRDMTDAAARSADASVGKACCSDDMAIIMA
eukprot:TRINITY_DN27241_c0_g1_i1.p1 TRINITY_DN27241_c0_g1~~TRINITY_DN27241_c0_g1_i1.p1  ORF type:complete len:236 (-),score=35.18 TRINITY_DN27241_c0_g1_i1:66-773(-)